MLYLHKRKRTAKKGVEMRKRKKLKKEADNFNSAKKLAELLTSSLPKNSVFKKIEVNKKLNCVIITLDDQKLAEELLEQSRKKRQNN